MCVRTAADFLGKVPHCINFYIFAVFAFKQADCAALFCLFKGHFFADYGGVRLNGLVDQLFYLLYFFRSHFPLKGKVKPEPLWGYIAALLRYLGAQHLAQSRMQQMGGCMEPGGLLALVGQSALKALLRSGAIDIVVIDSVAALSPRQEIDGDMGQSMVGVQARMMSQAMRKLSGVISKSNCVVIFINQIREKVGQVYGNPETTPGGRALKFFASVRIDVRKTEQLKDGNDIYGNHVKCKIVKNKVAPPFRVAEFDILYGKGISRSGEILDFAIMMDIIKKSGSWFSYNGDRIGQGKENVRKMLEGNPELLAEIEEKVRAQMDDSPLPNNSEEEFEVDDGDDFDLQLDGGDGEES